MPDAHLERLLAELGERARADTRVVDAEAEERIAQMRADETRRREAALAAAIGDCERAASRETADAVAAIKRERRTELLRAQHALVDRVLERARAELADCFEQTAGHAGIARRADELRDYACSKDVELSVSGQGIVLVADSGHLRIDDTIDAWLDAERPRLTIDICRMAESTTWSSPR